MHMELKVGLENTTLSNQKQGWGWTTLVFLALPLLAALAPPLPPLFPSLPFEPLLCLLLLFEWSGWSCVEWVVLRSFKASPTFLNQHFFISYVTLLLASSAVSLTYWSSDKSADSCDGSKAEPSLCWWIKSGKVGSRSTKESFGIRY